MNRRGKIALVLCCFAVCGGGALTHRAIEARRAAVPPGQLYEIVWKQIEAMRRADYSRAYQQVSTRYQEQVNLDAFSERVRSDYPTLNRAERVEFGSVRFEGRRALVQAYFILPEGEVIPCLYSLIHEENAWKIDGARVQRRWPAGRRLGGMRS